MESVKAVAVCAGCSMPICVGEKKKTCCEKMRDGKRRHYAFCSVCVLRNPDNRLLLAFVVPTTTHWSPCPETCAFR